MENDRTTDIGEVGGVPASSVGPSTTTTGGYASGIASNIIKAVGGIANEVETQYVLRYIPDTDPEVKPKAYRKIKVDIPMLPTAKIHARDGYYPFGVPQGGATTP